MTPLLAIMLGFTFNTSGGERHCDRMVSQSQFEAEGGRLQEMAGLSAKNLLLELGCSHSSCHGGTTQHAMISEDGSVVSTGSDATVGDGTNADIFIKRIEQMRFSPPRIKSKPVCVLFDVRWDYHEPEALRRIPK